MDVRKLGGLENIKPVERNNGSIGTIEGNGVGAPNFRETLNKVQSDKTSKIAPELQSKSNSTKDDSIRFSNHAVERMRSRGITFTPEHMQRLEDAILRAAGKGSKNSLVLMDDNALIVSVKNNTVVTVVDKNSMKENVFTNIDSTIVI